MKVFIENGALSYISMFQKEGWEIAEYADQADLIQFIGGSDVNPTLYGELDHPKTSKHIRTDGDSASLYKVGLRFKIPMAGICRGGQFLNVMNGGKMWQHVDGHALGTTHTVFDVESGNRAECSSTHHQMMRPSAKAIILATAKRSTFKENMKGKEINRVRVKKIHCSDIEALFYEETNSLCFQPHPEFNSNEGCRNYYFSLINRCLKLKA